MEIINTHFCSLSSSSSSSSSSFSVHDTSMYLGESVPVTSKYLTPPLLLQSAVLTSPSSSSTITADQAKRMRIASLSTLYVVLLRWKEIQEYSVQNKIPWPYVENNVQTAFITFSNIFTNDANATLLSEGGGHDLKWLKAQLKL